MKKTFSKFLSLLMTAVLLVGMVPAIPSAYATEEAIVVEQEAPIQESEAPVPEPVKEEAPAPEPVKEEAEAPVEMPEIVEEAPVEAPEATEEAPVEVPEATEEAPVEAPEATEEAPVEAPEATEEAPVEAPEATEEAPVEAPEATEEAPVEAPETTEEAPVEVPEATEEAPVANDYLLFAPYQDGMAVVGCTDAERVEVLIPASSNGKPVLLIAEDAFHELEKLESVKIEEGVEEIAKFAFHDCPALKQVKLPATLKEIAPDAFEGCPLTSIEAPVDTLASAFAKAWFAASAPAEEGEVDLMVLPTLPPLDIALSIVGTSNVLGIGKNLTLSAVISSKTSVNSKEIEWILEDPEKDKLVTLKPKSQNLAATLSASAKISKERTVTVTVKAAGKSASYRVTILPLTKALKIGNPSKTYLNLENPSDKIELTVNITPTQAAKTVQWSSSNTAIAKVDENGVVTPGHKAGTATITAKAMDGSGKSDKKSIRVLRAVTKISFPAVEAEDEVLDVAVKKTLKLVPAFTPSDVKAPALIWESSKPGVAKVSNGAITGVSASTEPVTITAYLKDDKDLKQGRVECSVKVRVHPLATGVKITNEKGEERANYDVEIDDTATKSSPQQYQLKAEVLSSAAIQTIAWSSSNSKVATIDENGVVELIAPPVKGKATVRFTAKAMDGSNKSKAVTLTFQRSVKEITIDGPEYVMAGKNFNYKAVISPANASDPAVAWSVKEANTGFTISNKGVLKAPKTSSVTKLTITATAKSGVVAQKTITVTNALGSDFNIVSKDGKPLPTVLDISDTPTLELKAVSTADATKEVPVVWKSSSKNAPISADGVLAPTKTGKVTITATLLNGKGKKTFSLMVSSSVKGVEKDQSFEEPITLVEGQKYTLAATVIPETAYNKKLAWNSSAPENVAVSGNGQITAKKWTAKDVTITAASQVDATKKTTFTVKLIPAVKDVEITLNNGLPDKIDMGSLSEENPLKLSAKVTPAGAQPEVEWKSSNPKVAAIAEDGSITVYKSGKVTFTATAMDGSKRRKTKILTFEYKPSKVEILNKDKTEFAAGEKYTFFAQVSPAAATQNVVWTVDPTSKSYASVNNAGVVTFKNNTTKVQTVTLTVAHKQYPTFSDKITVQVSPKPGKNTLVLKLDPKNPDKYVLAHNGDAEASTLQMYAYNAYSATELDKEMASLTYTWFSSKPSVATVDENGLVTGVSAGTAYITVKDSYGNTARHEVQVYDAAKSVTVEGNGQKGQNIQLNANAGEEITLTAKVAPDKANQYVTWSTDSDLIELVDDNEAHTVKVKAKENVHGEAIIKVVSDADERLEASCTLMISNIQTESITLDSTTTSFDAATTSQVQLKATVTPAEANQQLNWSSSNENVATVDSNGLVTFIGTGKTTITAAAKDGSNISASIDITVTISITSVTITGDTKVKAGKSITLSASVLPEIAKDTVTWSIESGKEAAEIEANGKLTAKAVETETTVVVKATSNTDKSKFAEHTVTVQPVPTEVTISPENPIVYVSKGTVTLKAAVKPSGASQNVTWSSEDNTVARVSKDGEVAILPEMLKDGTTVRITATCVEDTSLSATVEVTVKEMPLFEATKVTDGVTDGVKLTKYLGNDTAIEVPEEFNGEKVVALAEGLFKDNTTLTTLTLPSSITEIVQELCDGCSSLTTVNMSNSVTLIGEGAFRNCTKLDTFNCK